MSLQHDERSPVAVVEGEIDLSNARQLILDLVEAIPNTAHGMVMDLTKVTYLDSAGIHMLFELGRLMRRRRQNLTVVVPPGSHLKHVLDIVEMGGAIPVRSSVEQALEAIDEQ